MKPLGISLGVTGNGDPFMRVTRSSHAEDAVWSAVESWMLEGRTPESLKLEVAAAWAQLAKDEARRADKVLRAP